MRSFYFTRYALSFENVDDFYDILWYLSNNGLLYKADKIFLLTLCTTAKILGSLQSQSLYEQIGTGETHKGCLCNGQSQED